MYSIDNIPEGYEWAKFDDEDYNNALGSILYTEQNLNIIGSAGVGKSLLIELAYKMLSKKKNSIAVLSSTGKSAANILSKGIPCTTIHSFFKISPTDIFPAPYKNPNLQEVMQEVKVIIIDECSMITAALFDHIGRILHLYKTSEMQFPRILLFSDILQLPPVVNKKDVVVAQYYDDNYGQNTMFFNSAFFQDLAFKTIQLTKIYRQENVKQQQLLERIRIGETLKEDLEYLNQFVMLPQMYGRRKENYLYLGTTNKIVNEINQVYIRGLTTESKKYEAQIHDLTKSKDEPIDLEKLNIPQTIEIKEGAQVFMYKNFYQRNNGVLCDQVPGIAEYRNGMIGVVVAMCNNYVVVEIKGGKDEGKLISVVVSKTSKYKYNWERESKIVSAKEIWYVEQLDCYPCRALTVHKTQGSTIDNLYFDNSFIFGESLVYVALSRLRDLNNLGLKRAIKFNDIVVNQEALNFLEMVG
jgi:ATP-dependent exoDNAse (exonuclease V) alpha subunit